MEEIMEKKALKRLTALGLASLLLSGTVLIQTVHAEDNQPIAQFRVHKDGSQSIVGKTTPNTRLRIDYNGTIEAVSDAEGNYELKIPDDKKYGNYEYISIYSLDTEGNQTRIAEVQTDTQAPELNGISLAAGDTTLSLFLDEDTESISLKIGDRVYQGEKTENRNWETKFPFVSEGDTVTLTATDKAGNMTEQTATVSGLEAPTPSKTASYFEQYITGETYTDAEVHVLLPDGTELTGKPSSGHFFSVKIPYEHFFYNEDKSPLVWIVRNGVQSRKVEVPKISTADTSEPVKVNGSDYRRLSPELGGTQTFQYYTGSDNHPVLILPSGDKIYAQPSSDWWAKYDIPKDKIVKQDDKLILEKRTGLRIEREEFKADVRLTPTPQVNPVKVGDRVVGGTAKSEDGIIIRAVHVVLPSGETKDVQPDKYGNWILSIPEVRTGDTILAFSSDNVGRGFGSYSQGETIVVGGDKNKVEVPETIVKKGDTIKFGFIGNEIITDIDYDKGYMENLGHTAAPLLLGNDFRHTVGGSFKALKTGTTTITFKNQSGKVLGARKYIVVDDVDKYLKEKEMSNTHETGQANIQAELPEFPLKDVPEVDKDKKPTSPSNDDKKDPSTKKPVITSKGESTVQEELPEFPIELVPTFSGKQGHPTGQNPGNGNLAQGSQGLQKAENQGQKSSQNSMTSKKASLPKTGETASTLVFLAGLVVMGLAFLGLKGRRD